MMNDEVPTDSSKFTIQDLPDELLEEVFQYLTTYEVKKLVALVCKRWYSISCSSLFLSRLVLGPKAPIQDILSALDNASCCLRVVDIYGRKDVDRILEKVSEVTQNLEVLKVRTGKATKECHVSCSSLLTVLSTSTKLQTFVLKRTTVEGCDTFFQTFGKIGKNIIKINFNHSLQFGSEDLMDLVADCEKLKDVRIYCLAINRIGSLSPYGDAPMIALCHKMASTLEVLKINGLGLSDSVMPFIADCRSLYKLHVYRMVNIHDEAFEMITRLEALRDLTVTMPRVISSTCFKEIFSHSNLRHLTNVNISNSYSMDDEVLISLALNCQNLCAIGFPGCRKITDRGVGTLFGICKNLKSVNLFSTRACIAQTFPMIPELLPDLQMLVFRAIDKSGISFPDCLKEMPTLQLRQYYRYV